MANDEETLISAFQVIILIEAEFNFVHMFRNVLVANILKITV